MPALPDLDPSRTASDLYADLQAYIDEANALVAARQPIMLAGLDNAVAALCERIATLDILTAKEFAPKLDGLMAALDGLQANMRALQADVATAINSLGTQKKANRAYNNAPSGKVEE